MDPRDQFDLAVDAIGKFSLLMQLRDKVAIASKAGRHRCGNCYWWMKSRECPREKNMNGYSRGPNCNGTPCEKLQRTQSSIDLQTQRVAEAIEFAKSHNLPAPGTI